MPRPGAGRRVASVGVCVHVQGATARLVRRTDDQPHLYAVGAGEDQRDLQGEFLDRRAADEVACPESQFKVGRRRYDGLAEHGVIGEPVVSPQGPAAGEGHLVGARVVQYGTQHRVFRCRQARRGDVGGAGPGLEVQPVALPLKSVRREVHRAARPEQGTPVDIPAPDVELGERAEQSADRSPVPPRRREDHRVVDACGRERLGGDAREGRTRSQFEEDPRAGRIGGLHGGEEADGFTDVVHPVRDGRQFRRVGFAAQPGRDDRDRHTACGEVADRRRELVEDGVHEGRVERVVDVEEFRRGAVGHEEVAEFDDLVAAARKHHGVRAVDGGDAYPGVRGEQRGDVSLRGAHRQHRAALGDRLHEASAGGHQPGRAVEVQGAGDVGGGDLAHRVTDQLVRSPAEPHHEPVQGDLKGEQRGLGDVGAPGPGFRGCVGEEKWLEGEGEMGVEVCADLVEALREDGEGVVQLPCHTGPLGTLPREHEDRAAKVPGDAMHRPGALHAFGQRLQTAQQLVPAAAEHHRAMLEPRAACHQRPANVGDIQVRDGGGEVAKLPRLRPQRRSRPRGHDPGHQPARAA